MFSTKHTECVGFESRWKVTKVSSVAASQTTELSTTETESNTGECKTIEVQTDPNDTEVPRVSKIEEEKLAEWLKKIYPQVHKELVESTNSRAFRGYRLNTDTSDITCKQVQNVHVGQHCKDPEIGCHVTSLTWNCSNSTLGVSCTYKHQSWCYHEGFVAFYTLNRDDFLPETPKVRIGVESCVTVLEFHPVSPALVAGGLFTGNLLIWNIQLEQEQLLVKISGHDEAVTHLAWISDLDCDKNFFLVTSSLDGFVNVWQFSQTQSKLSLREKHQIKSPILPRNETYKSTTKNKVIRGVISFDFSKFAPDLFIVGAEGGMIVQCSRIGGTELPGSSQEVTVLDSSFTYYQSHKGEINSVSFSPNRKDMFMSSGSDSEIRIYMLGQEDPAQTIFLKTPLNFITWVPFEEKIVVGCGSTGNLEIFHLIQGKAIGGTTKDKVEKKMQTTLRINRIKSGIVAVGTEDGWLQMWRVPWASMETLSRSK